MKESNTKVTGQLAVILVLSLLLSFMIFSFGVELGREYYNITNP